jgi:hypothetical protein
MALFPIYGRFVGDFVPHLIPADTEDNMTQLAEKVAAQAVGLRVPVRHDVEGYELLVQNRVVEPSTKLGELGLRPLAWVDVRWRESGS